jgi:DNA polymerase zeta
VSFQLLIAVFPSLLAISVGAYIHQLHLSIDYALAVSYRRNAYDGQNHYVARITLVKGVPFYGFHVGYRYFLKIYMLNPLIITRLSDLLRQGAIMKKIFQPFEAHLQYLLQWMTDYNLYGCGYMDCRKVYFRGPVPKYEDMENLCHLWHDRSIPPGFILDEGVLPRVSHCSIEVDVCVQDIVNREEIKPRPLHFDFIERLNPMAPDEKLVHSMAGLWRDETRRRKAKMVDPDPGSSPFPPEVMISMSADLRNSQRGGWIHEEEYMESVHGLILEERSKNEGTTVNFETFVKPTPFDDSVKTAFESVNDLFPENLGPALGLKSEKLDSEIRKNSRSQDVEVDMSSILNLKNIDDSDEFLYDSEEDIIQEMEATSKRKGDRIENSYTKLYGNVKHDNDTNKLQQDTEDFKSDVINPAEATKVDHTKKLMEMSEGLSSETRGNIGRSAYELSRGDDPKLDEATDGEALTTSPISTHLGMKRPRSQVASENEYNKRQRIDEKGREEIKTSSSESDNRNVPNIFSEEHKNFMETNDSTVNKRLERNHSTVLAPLTVNEFARLCTVTTLGKRSSQEAFKPLGFPVVKDPQEPSTILRLSQGNSSQKSLDASPKKNVSFGSPVKSSRHSRKSSSFKSSSLESDGSHSEGVLSKVVEGIIHLFPHPPNSRILAFSPRPPNATDVISTMEEYDLPPVIYQDAYYSKESDVPERAREYAGREFKLESLTVPFLADFDATGTSAATFGEKPGVVLDKLKDEAVFRKRRRACKLRSWEIGQPPPTLDEVVDWVTAEDARSAALPVQHDSQSKSSESPSMKSKLSQIEGPSPKNKNGIRYTQQQKATSVQHEAQYMSTMSVEIHVNTRGNFVPNPEEDEVQCIFWCLQSDEDDFDRNGEGAHLGLLVLSEDGSMARKVASEVSVEVQEETSELDLIIRIVEIVRMHDPDILTGYEVHGGSWGYLIERARFKYDYNLCDEFSRMKSQSHGRFGKDNDKWGFNNTSTIRVTGRHMINIWRAMRSELNLLQYTMENVAFHVLQRRIPHYSWRDLTLWYSNGKLRDLATVLKYYLSRVQLNLEILERNELIPRTSEQARLLGVDFFSVFSRGSQFKVESLMFRIAKLESFLLVSPSRKQVGGQNALECLPLVMEPQSAFYNSPLLVLDFQSLYPSVMIAYNYCYSTFLGRIVNWRGTNKMGFTEYRRQHRLLELLKDHINVAPNGMMYVKPEIRKSLLAKMLGEILETRVMVKSGMKVDQDDKILQRLLNNRQLALKLIANVTYGYTSASFSGRMPCSEIADSIVQTARETLERAIALIHSVKRWGADVVYGDTDSLFIYLKGRTKDEAFDIGSEIAKMVTNMNPRPVKLKFEKVYFPCVLLAKKRYVGFKYESRDQKEPEFDAKGIETVRRDGTPAEQKIEEKALKILFRSADLSQVKSYFQKQCEKIMKGSVSIQDFCFAREVRLGTYSEKGILPPGALISTRRMLEDARAEPQYGERVPYVVITGAPGARLIDRCVAPETLLNSDHNELDAEYYISKNLIPPLERIFNLVGANVRSWYDEMPKFQRIRRIDVNFQDVGQMKALATSKKTLESYMKSSSCLVCRDKLDSEGPICATCMANRPLSLLRLRTRLSKVEKKSQDLERVCQSCSGTAWLDEVKCDSKDCPVFYSRVRQKAALRMERAINEPATKMLQGNSLNLGNLEW